VVRVEKETSRPPQPEASKSPAPPTSKKGGFFGKKKDTEEKGNDNAALVSRMESMERQNRLLTDRVKMLESKVNA
jgi:hypothetical protein